MRKLSFVICVIIFLFNIQNGITMGEIRNHSGTLNLRSNNFSLESGSFNVELNILQNYDSNNITSARINGVILCRNFSDSHNNAILNGLGHLYLSQKEVWSDPIDNPFNYDYTLYGSCQNDTMEGVIIGNDLSINGKMIAGTFYISQSYFEMSLFIDQRPTENSEKISLLETWQQSINDWKNTATNILSNMTASITSLLGVTDDHETRIEFLENQNVTSSPQNITILDYWKYLSYSDRKNIVCGLAVDNYQTYLKMEELGYECTVRYRQTSQGESSSCRCSKV